MSYFQNTTSGWQVIFWLAALMYILCSLPYMISFKAQVQPWNSAEKGVTSAAPVLVMSNVVSSDAEDGDVTALNKPEQ